MFARIGAVVLLFLAIGITTCYSQSSDTSQFVVKPGGNLLYYVDNAYNSKEFLIPYIEAELKSMTGFKEHSHGKLFASVNGLNYFVAADSAYNQVLSVFKMFSPAISDTAFNRKLKARDTSIFNRIKKAQFFFKININIFNNLLEYQFVLVRITVGTGAEVNFFDLDHYRTTSIFIDPNSPDYKLKIRNCLHQIISEANEPPTAIVRHNGQKIADTVFFTPGHLVLDAEATDADSSPDQITYNWEVSGAIYTGKKLDLFINEYVNLPVILRVSDGDSTIVQNYFIKMQDSPWVILKPNFAPPQFLNNRLSLYSFHKAFKNNDFSSLLNRIFSSTKLYGNVLGHDDLGWTKLMHRLTVVSAVDQNSQISFFQVKFNKVGDSIVNYKEIYMPDLSLRDESILRLQSQFSIKFDSSNPLKDTKGNIYSHEFMYSISLNTNSDEIVAVPSIKYFKVNVKDHDLQSSSNFDLKFVKISRFIPYTYFSSMYYSVYGEPVTYNQVGIGLEYILFQGFSADGTVGSSTSKSFSSPVTPFYKIGANINIFDYQHILGIRFSTVAMYKQSTMYDLDKKTNIINIYYNAGYRLRFGFGGSIEEGFSFSDYQPVSLSGFINYFPKGFNINSGTEMGLKLKFSFSSSK